MSCYLVFISDIFKATPHESIEKGTDSKYFTLESRHTPNIEFQNVRVCGTIVDGKHITPSGYQAFGTDIQLPNAPCEFTLDDGTATIVITCTSRIRNRGDAELLKVGSIVTVIGKVLMQKDCRVVQCIGFNIHADPTQEMVHALRVMQSRSLSFKPTSSDYRAASQLSVSSQGPSTRRHGYHSQVVPVYSPAKPQGNDMVHGDFSISGSKRREPPTDDNFDDSFLNTEEFDNLMNQVDKRQKLEPSSVISEDDNFGYSPQGTIPVGKNLAQQVISMIADNGTTLKDFVVAGLDFLAVEDSLSYLIATGQIYERDSRYYLL